MRAREKDSDSEMEDASKTKERVEDEEDEENGSEEEYEIEAILDAKNGNFADGTLGYLVKWKGYGEEHNSWVREDDAANAQALVAAYWKEHGHRAGKKPGPRKSEPKSKVSTAQKRNSPVVADESDAEPAPPKKRGRQSKQSVSDDEQPASTSKTAQKGRKSTGGGGSGSISTTSRKHSAVRGARKNSDPEEEEETQFASMKKWKQAPSWAHLVHHVETVERTRDGDLKVYFVLKSQDGKEGALCCEDAKICKEKMPTVLLDFYESNLRWRETDG